MGFFQSACGCLFFIFNLALFLCGAAILGIGIWLAVDSTGLTIFNTVSLPSAVDAGTIWASAVYIMIGMGAFFFLAGFLGCCGQKSNNTCLLWLFNFLLILTLLGLVTVGVLAIVFNSQINTQFEEQMTIQVTTVYNGENVTEASGNSVDYSWNYMQSTWKCCGSTGYTDYQNSLFSNSTGEPVPWSCCTMTTVSSLSIDNVENINECKAGAAAEDPNMYLSSRGCYTAIKTWTNDHVPILIGIGFSFALLLVLGIVISCCIQQSISSSNSFV